MCVIRSFLWPIDLSLPIRTTDDLPRMHSPVHTHTHGNGKNGRPNTMNVNLYGIKLNYSYLLMYPILANHRAFSGNNIPSIRPIIEHF